MTALVEGAGGRLVALARRHGRSGPGEPAWLADARDAATEWVDAHGFPTQKDEDWRYQPLNEVLDQRFELPVADAAVADARGVVEAVSTGAGGTRLVFVNGQLAAGLSRWAAPAVRAHLSSLGSALAAGDPRCRAVFPRSTAHRHGFAALNVALAADGALLDVPAGAVLAQPIELVFVTLPGQSPLVTSPRTLLCLGEGSRATVVETYAGPRASRYLTNASTRVHLDEGARLDHYRLQAESEEALHFSSLDVRQWGGSHLSSHLVTLGGRTARHEVVVRLDGEGAVTSLNGLYLPRASQHHDHPVLVEHAARGCVSRQRYVGVVDGRGHAVFNGHVVVRPGADGTDASQANTNLLLSEHAEVDTRPRLEIFADDVACTHGAAVGRLDADALFYLRSRGIPVALARKILVQGFARQMSDRLDLEPARCLVEHLVAGHLNVGAADPLPRPDTAAVVLAPEGAHP